MKTVGTGSIVTAAVLGTVYGANKLYNNPTAIIKRHINKVIDDTISEMKKQNKGNNFLVPEIYQISTIMNFGENRKNINSFMTQLALTNPNEAAQIELLKKKKLEEAFFKESKDFYITYKHKHPELFERMNSHKIASFVEAYIRSCQKFYPDIKEKLEKFMIK